MTAARACSDYELLLSLHAANGLRGDDRARLEAHLAACPECRDELDGTIELLQLARLPPPGQAERRVYASLPERTVEEVRQGERRRGVVRRVALAMGAVAALSLVPLLLRDAPPTVGSPRAWLERLAPGDAEDEPGRGSGRDGFVAAVDARRALSRDGEEHPQLASAAAPAAVAAPALVEPASWEEPDPDRLWEDSSILQALGEIEETAFAAEVAVQ